MHVHVQRVEGMPHNTQIWMRDTTDGCLVYIDQALITAEGARCLQHALCGDIGHWRREPTARIGELLRVHTG